MTELEKLMYKILGNMSAINMPVVFKGALITKLILTERGFDKVERGTSDIDCNWVDIPPSMNVLVAMVSQALGDLQNQYYAKAIREYEEKKSAGIGIIDKNTGDIIIEMDISMKPVVGNKIYFYRETSINGVLVNEILADKISVLSDKVIFRRIKDMIDIYALSNCVDIRTGEIYDIYNKTDRELKSFDEFLRRQTDLEHAYNKLRGVDGKPRFTDIYSYLDKFLRPFIEKDYVDKMWDSEDMLWH